MYIKKVFHLLKFADSLGNLVRIYDFVTMDDEVSYTLRYPTFLLESLLIAKDMIRTSSLLNTTVQSSVFIQHIYKEN